MQRPPPRQLVSPFFLLPLVLAAILPAGEAAAADPLRARYVKDGSQLFWFVQISDTHIDTVLPGEEDRLRWALTEGISVIQPKFVVNTGDITDSTDRIIYGTGPHEEEWEKYRSIIDETGMDINFYHDLPGNHDAYGDGGLENYLRWSLLGQSTGGWTDSWSVDLPFGQYHFYGISTVGHDGNQWPRDNNAIGAAELELAEQALAGHAGANLQIVFGHHDYRRIDRGDELSALLRDHGVGHYIHGHEHDFGMRFDDEDGVVRFRTDALGMSFDANFSVWAVDADTLSLGRCSAASPDAWPLIVITAPVNRRYGLVLNVVDPYAPPVPRSCADAPVRALIFDDGGVASARFRFDLGAWQPLVRRADIPEQWRGSFDAGALAPGLHYLEVEASGSRVRTAAVWTEVVEAECAVGEEDLERPPGADAGEPAPDTGPAGEELGSLDEDVGVGAADAGAGEEDAGGPGEPDGAGLVDAAGPADGGGDEPGEADAGAADSAGEGLGVDAGSGAAPGNDGGADLASGGEEPASADDSCSSCSTGSLGGGTGPLLL
ncbi:MAG: hypothetical protein FJ125_17060, partial [Deltaproteobacteria bacterium]|nr:hypothetical protein [Deltaproteobacteria bacterium]